MGIVSRAGRREEHHSAAFRIQIDVVRRALLGDHLVDLVSHLLILPEEVGIVICILH